MVTHQPIPITNKNLFTHNKNSECSVYERYGQDWYEGFIIEKPIMEHQYWKNTVNDVFRHREGITIHYEYDN